MNTYTAVLLGCLCCLAAGCSDSSSNSQRDNVFSQQIHAIDKAKEANKLMLDKAQEQKQEIDQLDQ